MSIINNLHNSIVSAHIYLKGKIFSDGKIVSLNYNGRVVKFVDNGWVAYPLEEIFIKEVYHRLDVKGKVVIDIGASVGDSAIYFMLNGATKVIGYDTDGNRIEEGRNNIKLNNLKDKIGLIIDEWSLEYIGDYNQAVFKVDIEGGEYALLPQLKEANPKEIIIEYHNGVEKIINYLKSNYHINSIEPASKVGHGVIHLIRE